MCQLIYFTSTWLIAEAYTTRLGGSYTRQVWMCSGKRAALLLFYKKYFMLHASCSPFVGLIANNVLTARHQARRHMLPFSSS